MSLAHAPASIAAPTLARWEPIVAALCLAQFSEPLFAAVAQSQGLTEPPGYARTFFLPVYGFLAWAVWRDRALAARAVLAAPLLIGLLALAAISAVWSIDAGASLRRAVWLSLSMLFGLYLAWRYDWKALLSVIAGAFLVLVAGSLLLGWLAPGIGRMSAEHPGAWSGLWTHKNTLGGIMAIGACASVAAAIAAPGRRRLWAACAVGALALVFLSTSKTALIASMLGLSVLGAGLMVRQGPLQAILVAAGASIAAIALAGIAMFAPDVLVAAIGRDLTLTGRTDIWDAAARFVEAKPWLGYGYYAFWIPEAGPAFWVREAVGWQVASAHSSWLELGLGLGRAGVVLFALQLCATGLRGLKALLDPQAGLWAPAFLAAFALYTPSESHALQANNLFWIIYVAVTARLALDASKSP